METITKRAQQPPLSEAGEHALTQYERRLREELREVLLDATTEIDVQRQRENPLAQDLGASLVLIMGTPAVVAVVQAIGDWLQKRRSASLMIVTAEKKIVAENLTNKDAVHLLQLFLTQNAEHKEFGP